MKRQRSSPEVSKSTSFKKPAKPGHVHGAEGDPSGKLSSLKRKREELVAAEKSSSREGQDRGDTDGMRFKKLRKIAGTETDHSERRRSETEAGCDEQRKAGKQKGPELQMTLRKRSRAVQEVPARKDERYGGSQESNSEEASDEWSGVSSHEVSDRASDGEEASEEMETPRKNKRRKGEGLKRRGKVAEGSSVASKKKKRNPKRGREKALADLARRKLPEILAEMKRRGTAGIEAANFRQQARVT